MTTSGPLAAALGCAVCYGVGSVLQQIGAQREAAATALDPRFLLRLVRQVPYLSGLGLDGIGWLLSLVALQTLPLFLVQAAVASSIAVTAIVARIVLHHRLDGPERVAIAVVLAGLVMLALAAAPESADRVGAGFRLALVAGVVVLTLAATVMSRDPKAGHDDPAADHDGTDGRGAGRDDGAGDEIGDVIGDEIGDSTPVGLAVVAGLAFGGAAVAGRVLPLPDHLWLVLRDPVLWALIGYGLLGTLVLAIALQRGRVTATIAILFAVETVVPAAIGVVALGDRALEGRWPLMVVGLVTTIGGAVALALRGTGEAAVAPATSS